MKKSVYKIGHVYIEVNVPNDMETPRNLSKFEADLEEENVIPKMRYYFEFVDNILVKEKELLEQKISGREAKRENLYVFQTDLGECRRINLVGDPFPYAMTLQTSEDTTKIWFERFYEKLTNHDTVFNSTLSLERIMIDDNAMIFHSAFINYKDTAVLFSAPSETGKTTQANLWEKHRGTYTVNGDRSLLIREEDGWYAHGWPLCGTSETCHNEAYPIRAIVMLKQAKENKVYRLHGIKALREIMGEVTINTWDREFQMKAMDQLEMLLAEVPVYMLECNISEDAVRCLEEELR